MNSSPERRPLEFCFHFDFDEHTGINKRTNFNHGGARADFPEVLSMGPAEFLPASNVRYEHACAHYILKRASGLQ